MPEKEGFNPKTAIICLLLGVIAGMLGMVVTDAVKDYKAYNNRYLHIVGEVCDYSREVNSAKWKEACGNVQEGSNTEYLCKNYQDGTFCWVEKK